MSNLQTKTAPKPVFTVRETCYAGLFAAVIAIMAQISIPMPGGVPMTMQTFAVTLAAVVLGAKLSTVSMVIYLILGAACRFSQDLPADSRNSSARPAAF